MQNLIKNYFKGYSKKGIVKNFPKFIKNNSEVEVYLNNILSENPNWESIKNIIYGVCFDEKLKKCKNCGTEMKYSQRNNEYCSPKCRANSDEFQENYKQTCLKKYGCENPAQSKKIQEKTKHTNLKRLGCEYPAQNKEIQEKYKQTCIERYGCEYPIQNKEIKNKIKQTNLERLGCENPAQSKEIQEKTKHTNLKRLGCEYPAQNEKVKRIHYDKSYDNFILSFTQYGIVPLFPKEEYTGWDKTYKWKCLICQNEFEQKIHTTGHVEECPYLPHCWNCYPRLSGVSKAEIELLDFVKQYFPNARQHDRTIIGPYELDIVIPEIKLAIEFDGDYWHSTKCWLENHDNLNEYYNYHLNKVLETNKKGYRLIHIWENNYEEIKKKLIDILEDKENLNFTGDTIKLDRSWYNNIEISNYKLVGELPPEMINRNGFNVENCGYLIYERCY